MCRSNKICTLWVDGPLRLADQVSLTSMVKNDLDVTLYTYGNVENVPTGITIANGEDVLPLVLIERLKSTIHPHPNSGVAAFSDFFRIECQNQGRGMWLDSDMLIFRPFTYDQNKMYFAKENYFRIGFSALHLPMTNPICQDYIELRNSTALIPPWLGFKRRVIKPLIYKIKRQEYSAIDLGTTIYANDGFTRLAKHYGYWKYAKPKKWVYHWSAKDNFKMFRNYNFDDMIDDHSCIGLHIHKKSHATIPAQQGSLWEWALKKYGYS